MAPSIPTAEPTEAVAGDSWAWDLYLPDYPASEGWEISYTVRGPTDLDIVWSTHVSANGDTYEVRVPASATDLTPSTYKLAGRATKGTEKKTFYAAAFTIRANPATAVNALSHHEEMVADLKALEKQLVENPEAEIQRGDRTWRYRDLAEVRKEITWHEAKIQKLRNPGAMPPQRKARFNAPS